MNNNHEGLKRSLGVRQMRLLALGSTIGVGLFLGSASAIKVAGPSILLAYLVAGVMTFFILRALGEMAIQHPVTGSFAAYASLYVNPFLGYLVGWGYWFYWTIIAIAEVTAVGIYMQYWFPGSGQWIWAFSAIAVMGTVNLFTARVFGEFEFWFALIKVATILVMIGLGLFVIIFGFPGEWAPVGLSNLTTDRRLLSSRARRMSALDADGRLRLCRRGNDRHRRRRGRKPADHDPHGDQFLRLAHRYLLCRRAVRHPCDLPLEHGSASTAVPLCKPFSAWASRRRQELINFVVVTAALSSCNGGIFSSGRILHTLAGRPPGTRMVRPHRAKRHSDPRHAHDGRLPLPWRGAELFHATQAFEYLTAAVTFIGISDLAQHHLHACRFRRRLAEKGKSIPTFSVPFWPFSSLIAAAFLIGVIGILVAAPETGVPVLIGLLLLCLIAASFRLTPGRREEGAQIAATPPSAPTML